MIVLMTIKSYPNNSAISLFFALYRRTQKAKLNQNGSG